MGVSIGNRIAALRKAKNMTQSELAEQLGVSPQAVSKWENDLAYPDITLLGPLAEILGCSIDNILKPEQQPETIVVPEGKRKNIDELIFKVRIRDGGDKVNINLPMALLTIMKDSGNSFLEFAGSSNTDMLNTIDFDQLISLAEKGVLGKLIEIESEDGSTVEIFVE